MIRKDSGDAKIPSFLESFNVGTKDKEAGAYLKFPDLFKGVAGILFG